MIEVSKLQVYVSVHYLIKIYQQSKEIHGIKTKIGSIRWWKWLHHRLILFQAILQNDKLWHFHHLTNCRWSLISFVPFLSTFQNFISLRSPLLTFQIKSLCMFSGLEYWSVHGRNIENSFEVSIFWQSNTFICKCLHFFQIFV